MTSGSLGFLGLGLLGSALAERALAGGFEVVGFDLSESCRANLQKLGGQPKSSASEVASFCRRLVLALPDDNVCREVLAEIDSALIKGTVVIDTTTGDPDGMSALGRTLAERGVTYLDAAISGSSAQVRLGEALMMVGGPAETFVECQDLFHVLAREALHIGPCGSGAKMKLVTNLVLGLNRAALAEGLVFAAALGLTPEQTCEILRASMAYSRIMDTKGSKMLQGDFEPQAKLAQHRKDVDLMLAAAARTGQHLPLSETHRIVLEYAERLGLGQLDNSAIVRAIEQMPLQERPE
ncbi:MAG TPA: NAD(P)-dependent oxidoreductase [Gemmataceae bacterium]|nr:NAD(P)-dependent oxidoreductase [Gemmataceae bacterium]